MYDKVYVTYQDVVVPTFEYLLYLPNVGKCSIYIFETWKMLGFHHFDEVK